MTRKDDPRQDEPSGNPPSQEAAESEWGDTLSLDTAGRNALDDTGASGTTDALQAENQRRAAGRLAPGKDAIALGDYLTIEELGRGGMGVVYLALHRAADRVVALKLIRGDRLSRLDETDRREVVERFRAEAQAAAKLDHDNIVTVYDVGEADGEHYYTMRYVEGKSLADCLSDGPLENRASGEVFDRRVPRRGRRLMSKTSSTAT